jgi:hypothetical protein
MYRAKRNYRQKENINIKVMEVNNFVAERKAAGRHIKITRHVFPYV